MLLLLVCSEQTEQNLVHTVGMQGLLLLVCGVNDVMGRNQPGREVEKAQKVFNVGFSKVLNMFNPKVKLGSLYENKMKY